tara:strand:- start:11 stop:880 length:870 start_codon:yes stop_codon:yes gene_type:complete
MITSISKKSTSRSSMLFFTLTAFILSALLFTSCSDVSDLASDDTALIEKIESAEKTTIDVTGLPSATDSAFNGDLSDSFAENVELANGLGYKVSIISDNDERAEKDASVYFNLEGRQLEDRRENSIRRRHRCFRFSFPITFFMPDNSTITLESREDWVLVRHWYRENPDANERPELIFPIDIILNDGTIQTLLNIDELRDVKRACRENRNQRKCFKLVLPVSFTMQDATVIDVTERADFRLLKEWHIANPDATERASLNFPVDIEYRDGTIVTINNQTEFDAAKEACRI